jgi:drug/metabolite transporter (DMT)-like permease
MKSEKLLMVGGFILISLIWGSTWYAIKIGLESVPPFFGVAIRFTVAGGVLFLLLRLRGEKLPLDKDSISVYVTLAFLSFSFPFALVYWGEQYIDSGLASILFAVYPFVVATMSHFFLPSEKLNAFKVIGIVLGFIGVLIIFWDDIHIGDSATSGMIAILVSTVMQGTSLVIVKKRSKHLTPTLLTFGGMVIGVMIMYLLAFTFEDISSVRLDGKGIGSIVYLGTFGTVVTFLVYYWLLKRVEAVYLSLVSLVTPILAIILGTILLDESLSPQVFSGAALVLLGICVANGRDLLAAVQKQKYKLFSNESSSI